MKQLPADELRAWRAFLYTHATVIRRLDTELQAERGLTLSAYEVLLHLRASPSRRLRMSELAGRVMLSPSGCTRVVDQLVKQGLIERRRDSCDARSQLATLTGKGLEELRAAAPVHVRGIREHFTGRLDAEQLEAVASGLEAVGAGQTQDEALSRS